MEDRTAAYASVSVAEAFQLLGTGPTGLSQADANTRLRTNGPNQLQVRTTRLWTVLGRQFRSAFVVLLLLAAGIALGLGEYLDAGLILAFIFLNATLGFVQEYRAERSLEALRLLIPRKTHVRRDGKVEVVDVAHIVPGDVVLLDAGDQVPADLRVVRADGVLVDESILSGESVPVAKDDAVSVRLEDNPLNRRNMLFSGSTVADGEVEGVVCATGMRTMMGGMAYLAVTNEEPSNLSRSVSGFSRFILVLTTVTLVGVIVAKYAIAPDTFSLPTYLIFAIALAVGVIPEALPLVVTVALSTGGLRLARKQVIPKRLSAIEDLGSIQVLCTDKTGTITENALSVSDVLGDRVNILGIAFLGSPFLGKEEALPNNAFDRAVWHAAGEKERRRLLRSVHEAVLPFTPERRRSTVLVRDPDGQRTLIVRGAPEAVLPSCTAKSKEGDDALLSWAAARGKEGKRILVVATRRVPANMTIQEAERDGLAVIGAVAFIDPLKPDAKETIARARDMGVQVKILTGDSPEVAGAVAVQVGLIPEAGAVVSGEQFRRMPQEKKRQVVLAAHVFARVTPDQKYEILKLLKETAVVGFLGEGVNDVPALTLAHVGLAVDGAADVAKDAADVVLRNHALSVIIDGILEGRRTFANTVKYIKATLTSNFGNFFALAAASLFVPFLPMLPTQVLLLNLLSDFPMISIATDSTDTEDVRTPEAYRVRDVVLMAMVLGVVSTSFDFIMFAFFLPYGERTLQTMWWVGSILTELALFYSIRTRLPFWRAGRPGAIVIALTMLAAAIAVTIPWFASFRSTFHFALPSLYQAVALPVIVIAYFGTTELVKLAYVRYLANGNGHHPPQTP